MRQEISKQTAAELSAIAKNINDREKTIEQLKQQTVGKANETLTEAILQGRDLLHAKQQVPHGLWDDWLTANCPNISRKNSYRYMTLAKNVTRVGQIEGADSIRGALALIAEHSEKDETQSQKWPAYLHGLARFNRALAYLDRNPIDAWPDEGKEKLKEDLLPIATKLWPNAQLA